MLIDTHCHLNFLSYDADRSVVLERAAGATVTQIVNPGIDLESSAAGIQLHQVFPSVFAAVGIHPNSSAETSSADLAEIESLARQAGVIAIGEIGLDYHWDKSPKQKQWQMFEAQLELAAKLALPVIIHNRESSDDVIAILEMWAKHLPASLQDRPGVLHSVAAPPAVVERALAIGFYVGFTGPITFKKAEDTRALAALAPIERIVLETDGPYLTPEPYRGKRNEPAYIPYIAAQLAKVKRLSPDMVAHVTTANARHLFGLPTT